MLVSLVAEVVAVHPPHAAGLVEEVSRFAVRDFIIRGETVVWP